MRGALSGFEDNGCALGLLREKDRRERVRGEGLERDILMEMGLWAMVDCSVWREEMCGERWKGCIIVNIYSGGCWSLSGSRNEAAMFFASLVSLFHCVGHLYHADLFC